MVGDAHFDVLIIGGGQAGIPLAYALAEAGKRVALAERKHLGGSCVNFGCTPTKAAIASARVAHLARRGAEFGLGIPSVEVDFSAVLARAKKIVLKHRNHLSEGFDGSDNPRLLRGHARLKGREGAGFRVRVGNDALTAEQVVLDTGTRSLVPPIEGLDTVPLVHAENWLDLPALPEHVAFVGGGYIALEMGQFFRRMGSQVTLIERTGQVAGHEDADVAAALQTMLEAEGIRFLMHASVQRVERCEGGVSLTLEQDGRALELRASHLFVATGRKPNTDDLGLETVGVRVSEHGIVEADRRLATSVHGVWAAGDIRGGPMFTHTSWDDHRILLSQMVGDGTRTTDRVAPYAIFTDPEMGRVGMTEREAREAGKDIRVARYEVKDNGKAQELGETQGFIKVVVDASTQRLLGASVLCNEGAELVHMYVDIMNADAPYTVIRDAIHIHPTLAEAVQSAVSALDED